MATTKDVARRAGVSMSTVSHVLNATRFVAPERRERVLSAMRDLGYEPNAVARSLRVNRSRAIGLIISDIGNPFFTAVVRGVEDAAQAAGYIVILCNSDEDPDKEETYLRQLRSNRVDGLILAPAGVAHAYLRALVRQASPVVFIDREVPTLEVSAVVLANEPAAHAAVDHLIKLGHRRIGMIIGRPPVSTTDQRRAGYERALVEAGVAIDPRLIKEGGSKVEPGQQSDDDRRARGVRGARRAGTGRHGRGEFRRLRVGWLLSSAADHRRSANVRARPASDRATPSADRGWLRTS